MLLPRRRVGISVSRKQPCCIDMGIALGGGEAGMAQQLLNIAQFGAVA